MREYVIGHYFSNCLKKLMKYLKNPDLLDIKEEIFVEENNKQEKLRTYNKIKLNKNVKKVLKKAKNIELEFDVYQKEDKYHRALCYVYADGKSVQEQLLIAGLAEIKYVKEPDTRYLKTFKKAQNIAKSNKRNLWS